MSSPIPKPEVTYFVNGSCFIHAGYAVVKEQKEDFVPVITKYCNQPCSAQLAELRALTMAYTDSVYAHGVCHLFGAVWKQRGFKKSDGTPIQHAEQIVQLIIKCQAHKNICLPIFNIFSLATERCN